MRGFLSILSWLLAGIFIIVGMTGLLMMDGPMGVILPMPEIAMASGVLLLVIALPGIRRKRRWQATGTAGILIAVSAIVVLVIRPACEGFSVVVDDGVKLHVEACLPNAGGDDNWPVALFVHGSGRVTGDELRFYARRLASEGIASIVFDKRGAGESGGNTYAGSYERYASDIVAVAARVRDKEFSCDAAVGLVGFSEAEWTMPLAAREMEPDFIVVTGASGLTPHEQVGEEIAIRLSRSGFDPAAQSAAARLHQDFGEYLRGTLEADEFRRKLEAARAEAWFDAAGDFPDAVYDRDEYAWWRNVMDFDARPYWGAYTGPVLFLKGEQDDRSRAQDARQRFLEARSGQSVDAMILSGADHMLLTWPLGEGVPPPSFADGYPQLLAEWIHRQVGGECK